MNRNDLILLAKTSLKNNKKQNNNTIVSLAFSMIILVFIYFLGLSFYGGIKNNCKKYPISASIRFQCSTKKDLIEVTDLINASDIKEEITYQNYYISYFSERKSLGSSAIIYYPSISIDNVQYAYELHDNDEICVFDNNQILQDENDFLKKSYGIEPLKAGRTLSSKPNEIVLSSRFVDDLKLQYDDLIGKTISYEVKQETKKYGKDTEMVKLFENYTIVGVFDEKIYFSPSRGENNTFVPTFWVNQSSDLKTNSKIEETSVYCSIVSFNNFDKCYSYLVGLEQKHLEMVKDNRYLFFDYGSLLADYSNYKPLFDFLMNVFTIFGAIVLFSTLINLYITTSYSYQKKRRYLAMCKAMGMKNKDVKKMLFYECFFVFGKATLISIIISFVMCLSSTFLMNELLLKGITIGQIVLRIHFYFYLPILFVIIVFTISISMLISQIICHMDENEKITNLLKSN